MLCKAAAAVITKVMLCHRRRLAPRTLLTYPITKEHTTRPPRRPLRPPPFAKKNSHNTPALSLSLPQAIGKELNRDIRREEVTRKKSRVEEKLAELAKTMEAAS